MKKNTLAIVAVVGLASTSVFGQWMANEPAPAPVRINNFQEALFDDGARINEGTWALGGSAFIDTYTAMGTDVKAELSMGYYIMYGLMVGGFGDIRDNDWFTSYSIGGTCKWHFFDDPQSPFSLFCGGDLGISHAKTELDSKTALVIGGRVGLDFFITRSAAVETSFNLNLATGDIYADKDGLTNVDFTVKIGLVFFY